MPAQQNAIDLALTAAEAAANKLATDIVILDVSEQLVITVLFCAVFRCERTPGEVHC